MDEIICTGFFNNPPPSYSGLGGRRLYAGRLRGRGPAHGDRAAGLIPRVYLQRPQIESIAFRHPEIQGDYPSSTEGNLIRID